MNFAYTLASPSNVALDVFDLRGQRLRGLVPLGLQSGGDQTWAWDGLDDRGASAPAGLYLARLRVNGEDLIRRFPMIR